ncbi:hypothetical protein FRC02_009148 [Tulasnella sp. 418]|nr:hypothetical protein FRC02_009148 [Tulasnella sp. 418]
MRPQLHHLNRSNMSTSLNTGSQQRISDAIIQDHNELRDYYKRYNEANTDEERQQWFNQFQWELARHSVGEELVLYPAFEKNLGDEGKRIADEDRAEHQKAKELLYQLDKLTASDAEHPTLLKQLVDELTEHMRGEEENDLPKFEQTLTAQDSASLARSFARTKKFAPTRSHPNAPDKPPFETAAGLLATPIDKLRDLFTSFPETA